MVGKESFTKEERRYWRREKIKAVLTVLMLVACWAIIEAIKL